MIFCDLKNSFLTIFKIDNMTLFPENNQDENYHLQIFLVQKFYNNWKSTVKLIVKPKIYSA